MAVCLVVVGLAEGGAAEGRSVVGAVVVVCGVVVVVLLVVVVVVGGVTVEVGMVFNAVFFTSTEISVFIKNERKKRVST